MKKLYILSFSLFFFLGINKINAQNVSTSSTITFTKANNSDWTLEENQDRITNAVWLTRQDNGGLFNIAVESDNIVNGQDVLLHLITDDIYIDIKFISWQGGSAGGGFSYERSTDQSLSTNEFELEKKLKIFPNPSSDFIQVSGLTEIENYKICNILGA